ncbi:MAG: tRNA guanosine(34) transglycosylase Tgt [Patescibacteria group bacterium]|jgi:queuine tRNA-ribosyltransferase
MSNFKLVKQSKNNLARKGILHTAHGDLKTPFFMPIATKASVKALSSEDILELESGIILSNTYHLYLRPGMPVIKKAGGLHKFMNWPGAILTDSGGYQVFSLGSRNNPDKNMVKLSKKGVEFRSTYDGSRHMLTPEKVIKIQETIGSDIMMVLDECPAYPATIEKAKESMELTTHWAERSKKQHVAGGSLQKAQNKSMLFGIVQGSSYKDLRIQHANDLKKIGFDGYAIGGLAVGEPTEKMYEVLDWVVPELPEDKPRYLMGVGKPEQIYEAVKRGVDMFDCVIPTRNARHGLLYIWRNKNLKGKFYEEIRIKQSKYRLDLKPVDTQCDCATCKNYSRSYLRHLFSAEEPLAYRLATIHNVHFYLELMKVISKDIGGVKF